MSSVAEKTGSILAKGIESVSAAGPAHGARTQIEKLCMAWGTVGAVGAGCAVSRARIVRSGMRVVCALVRAVGVACMVAFKHGERSPR